MDHVMAGMGREKGKKGLILTTWERCKSIGRGGGIRRNSSTTPAGIKRFLTRKTKSWPRIEVDSGGGGGEEEEGNGSGRNRKGRWKVAPEGCFSVYVGEERERFVIRTEYANHPLFRMLLEEAEEEYGYNSQAPLWLPCNVDIFYRVLTEMDDDEDGGSTSVVRRGCGYPKPKRLGIGSYHLLSPSRALVVNHSHF